MKPSYKELFTKIYVSYQGMEPNYIYYLDTDDYSIKRLDSKRFLNFEKHFLDFEINPDTNSEQALMMDLALSNGKLILPKPISSAALAEIYRNAKTSLTLEEVADLTLRRSIQVWLDFNDLYSIEADHDFYSETFFYLAMIFNANLFDLFYKNNILHYQEGEDKNGLNFYYYFNRKDFSFTITDNEFGLSNIQCLISSPDMFDKNILRTLRRAFVITFKKENRCTQDTIALYEKYESKDSDCGVYVPKITYYEDGVITENGLRMYQAQTLNQMLYSLVTLVNSMGESGVYPEPGKCYLYRNSKKTVEQDPDIDLVSKMPFVNLLPYKQACFNVRINKEQTIEFIFRIDSYKKISSRGKATVYECLILDHDNGDVLERFKVTSSRTTIQDIMRNLINYAYKNGWGEHTIVDSVLESHMASILSNGKSHIEYGELTQIDKLYLEEKDSVNLAA